VWGWGGGGGFGGPPPPPPPPTPVYDDIWRNVYGDLQEHGPAHRHLRRLLRQTVADLDFQTVLDVGCGTGDNLPMLLAGRTSARFVGVDVSKEALARARHRHPGHDFVALDIERQALPDCFDLVFSSLVLEHLPNDEAALRNMHAMTGGRLVVATIGGNLDRYRPWEEQVGHVRNYRSGELERLLDRVGFEVERTLHWGFPFYNPITRLLQNRMSATPSYGGATRLVARLTHAVYRLNSDRRGDLIIVVARPRPASLRGLGSSPRASGAGHSQVSPMRARLRPPS